MKVEFLGTGTSQGIPVISCDCEVCQSSAKQDHRLRTSIHIQVDDTSIVIDTGPDFRYQMLRANIKRLDAILITHEHNDHLAGLDDIRPFNFHQNTVMDVHALPRVASVIENKYDYVFNAHPYPGAPRINLKGIDNDKIYVNDIGIDCLPVFHGEMTVMGFRIGDFAYITDANYLPERTLERLVGTRYLVLNALRKEEHHSHFSLSQAIEVGRLLKVEQLYLTHISHSMGIHSEVQKELPSWVRLSYDGLQLNIDN